ncbi:MAG: CAP domain-containing protein [Solirubrobacteraceae bacterium]
MPQPLRRATVLTLACAGLLLPAATSHAGPAKGVVRASQSEVRARIAIGPARPAQQGCTNADVMPTHANEPEVRAAILCLHNEIRAERGLPALRENARLRRAAVGHSRDMVGSRFFEHTTPAGVTMAQRIMAARYASRDAGWSLGENLAWGTGSLATPRSIVRAWMSSPGHRANIVKRAYREIGIGVVTGIPSGGSAGATYTADFGVIRR